MSQSVSVSAGDFRAVLGRYATGITVVTAIAPDGTPVGLTVNSFTSVSLDPPLILFCLDRDAGSLPVFDAADGFAVNILGAGQEAVSSRFADPEQERFAADRIERWVTGAPIHSDALAALDCAVEARHDGGDHVIMVGRVLRTGVLADRDPLVYWRGEYRHLRETVPA